MAFGRFISLPVMVVLLIIGFVYHTIVFFVLKPWVNLSTTSGIANLILLTVLCSMALFSYTLAVIRDPGYIPASYLPDVEDEAVTLHEVKRKGGDMRYCQKCAQYKPPRAHHCRGCKRCVLRMACSPSFAWYVWHKSGKTLHQDHHCVWINNCVGHNNYKAFFLFLLYVVAASLQSLVLLGAHFFDNLGEDMAANLDLKSPPVTTLAATSALSRVICAVIVVPVLVAVGVLLAWHIFLLLHNKTTIEYHEGVRARWLAEKAGQHYRHPYDVGLYANLVSALGPSVLCWFCPTVTGHLGSGIRFQTFNDDILQRE